MAHLKDRCRCEIEIFNLYQVWKQSEDGKWEQVNE